MHENGLCPVLVVYSACEMKVSFCMGEFQTRPFWLKSVRHIRIPCSSLEADLLGNRKAHGITRRNPP
jgi:hypothetical protein